MGSINFMLTCPDSSEWTYQGPLIVHHLSVRYKVQIYETRMHGLFLDNLGFCQNEYVNKETSDIHNWRFKWNSCFRFQGGVLKNDEFCVENTHYLRLFSSLIISAFWETSFPSVFAESLTFIISFLWIYTWVASGSNPPVCFYSVTRFVETLKCHLSINCQQKIKSLGFVFCALFLSVNQQLFHWEKQTKVK